jgi:hypothetical protein
MKGYLNKQTVAQHEIKKIKKAGKLLVSKKLKRKENYKHEKFTMKIFSWRFHLNNFWDPQLIRTQRFFFFHIFLRRRQIFHSIWMMIFSQSSNDF